MANPNGPGDLEERRKLLELLDRLAAVDRVRAPKCMPDVITDQWLHGDPEGRRKIEEAISRMPRKSN
jgi:hypothetical protein